MTNLPWVVEADALAARFGFEEVALLNDLEAAAWGVGQLREDELRVLQAGRPGAAGNAVVVAAGTGLGVAGLFWDGRRHHPFAGAATPASPRPATWRASCSAGSRPPTDE